jgi:hypothetical protein
MSISPRTTSVRALMGSAAILSVLVLSACGGSSTTGGGSSAAVPSDTAAGASGPGGPADFAAYRSCLADNGVTLPDMGVRPSGAAPSGMPGGPGAAPSGMPGGAPGAGGFPGGLPDGVDQATFDTAQKACASLAPQGGRGMAGGPRIDATALAAYKSCLTDHKVTVPDGDNWMATLDRSDATVKSAMDTCAPLLPVPTARPAASPSPSPAAS